MSGDEPDRQLVEQVRRRLAGLGRDWTPMDVAHAILDCGQVASDKTVLARMPTAYSAVAMPRSMSLLRAARYRPRADGSTAASVEPTRSRDLAEMTGSVVGFFSDTVVSCLFLRPDHSRPR